MFNKITSVNGIDTKNPQNARQNNYAWSMAEFGDYIYVGTGRNIVHLGMKSLGLDTPPEFLPPPNASNNAEIWRYPKNGKQKKWSLVYTAPQDWLVYGFRSMIVYKDESGNDALICGCTTLKNDASYIIMSTDGNTFNEMTEALPGGYNTRSMFEFEGMLYCGATDPENPTDACYLFCTSDLSKPWQQVELPTGEDMPAGEIVSMAEFNQYLYIGTALSSGFGVWKTKDPASKEWTLVVDKGAGDELNEVAITMRVFKDCLYVGTAIWMAINSVDPEKNYVPMKGFDVVKVYSDDKWEILVGSDPILPSNPKTGVRNKGKYPSGFGSIFNNYCWQMCVHDEQLFIASWDSALTMQAIIKNMLKKPNYILDTDGMLEVMGNEKMYKWNYHWINWIKALLQSLKKYPKEHGFDCYKTKDGKHCCTVSLTGFGNPKNYGIRTMVSANDGKMYIGTANPFQGCEVWTYEKYEVQEKQFSELDCDFDW